MKRLRLSKASWLILSAGIFIVVLAGLGVTRSQQLKEQTQLEEELNLTTMRVEQLQATELRPQYEELLQRVEEGEAQLKDAKDRMRQTVESVDVTEKFFIIAEYCGVTIMRMNTTPISKHSVESVECSTISVTTFVEGEVPNIIDFIISLNDGFTTGYIETAQIIIPDESSDEVPTATVQMTVYAYKGK